MDHLPPALVTFPTLLSGSVRLGQVISEIIQSSCRETCKNLLVAGMTSKQTIYKSTAITEEIIDAVANRANLKDVSG